MHAAALQCIGGVTQQRELRNVHCDSGVIVQHQPPSHVPYPPFFVPAFMDPAAIEQ